MWTNCVGAVGIGQYSLNKGAAYAVGRHDAYFRPANEEEMLSDILKHPEGAARLAKPEDGHVIQLPPGEEHHIFRGRGVVYSGLGRLVSQAFSTSVVKGDLPLKLDTTKFGQANGYAPGKKVRQAYHVLHARKGRVSGGVFEKASDYHINGLRPIGVIRNHRGSLMWKPAGHPETYFGIAQGGRRKRRGGRGRK